MDAIRTFVILGGLVPAPGGLRKICSFNGQRVAEVQGRRRSGKPEGGGRVGAGPDLRLAWLSGQGRGAQCGGGVAGRASARRREGPFGTCRAEVGRVRDFTHRGPDGTWRVGCVISRTNGGRNGCPASGAPAGMVGRRNGACEHAPYGLLNHMPKRHADLGRECSHYTVRRLVDKIELLAIPCGMKQGSRTFVV